MFGDHSILKRWHCEVRVQSVWEAMFGNWGFLSCWETPMRIIGSVLLRVNTYLLFSPVIQPSLMLEYGDRMEKTWVAHCRVEEEGFCFREAERVIESKLFLDEYPRWGLGTPTSWLFCMRCSFMLLEGGRKRQNVCAAEAAKAASQNLIPRWINLPWS